jgi:hypothetical protein
MYPARCSARCISTRLNVPRSRSKARHVLRSGRPDSVTESGNAGSMAGWSWAGGRRDRQWRIRGHKASRSLPSSRVTSRRRRARARASASSLSSSTSSSSRRRCNCSRASGERPLDIRRTQRPRVGGLSGQMYGFRPTTASPSTSPTSEEGASAPSGRSSGDLLPSSPPPVTSPIVFPVPQHRIDIESMPRNRERDGAEGPLVVAVRVKLGTGGN